ncbi:inner centromere protein isoform X6 [Teleopsis dalmanni]|uniref:inner centromere protein isoform X6 n=1 Tax=Teleopsis dalmanni TaxID=139649 RepID=UPI0018CDC5E4|nr:inner centromere protein isoform X6 [Teleopsis dalmanni]
MASLGGDQQILTNSQTAEPIQRDSREGSAERRELMESTNATIHWFAQVGGDDDDSQVAKDRDEKLKLARERQNEERQRKIEELKAQAEAAQRYQEQKQEERRRRIEEIRNRDSEKRHQVEERKRAIMEAEKERREYILRKNQERESRLETKKRDRNSIAFAFGSSTPRLLDPADYGTVSPSQFWSQRRSTSISNVAGATLSRRSSERELADSGAKKRATSASGTERHDEDNVDTSHIVFRSVARRKTDLMPTIPSPRDGHYGSRSSLSHTPRTPGRAFSMTRLDQLAQPIRRNGEHIRAILERERREHMEMFDETESLGGGRRTTGRKNKSNNSSGNSTMSRSMTHLAGNSRPKYSLGGGISTSFRPLGSNSSARDGIKSTSMTHLTNSWVNTPPRSNLGLQTAATKKYLQSSLASSTSATKRGQQHFTNPYRFDPNSLLLMNSSFLITAGSRSGNVTPGGSINTSRPGSAMSTSTNMSTSGFVNRRSAQTVRKPRPASIAGTGVSLDEINKLKKENKPPMKSSTASASAQTTPKRTTNMMSTSLIVTSSSSRLSSAEKRTPSKKDSPLASKSSTPKSLSKTASSDRLNKISKDKPKDMSVLMTKSAYVAPTTKTTITATSNNNDNVENINEVLPTIQSKDEKNALNAVKTEETNVQQTTSQNLVTEAETTTTTVTVTEEKVDVGNEKNIDNIVQETESSISKPIRNGSKENSEVRELTPPTQQQIDNNDLMTASMIAKKITTEEEAKAALAERRRLAREEAERQAELERQRIEAERQAEIKRQEEEAERQRKFEEEATRLAEEQRKAEEERLRQAIEEAKKRDEEERLKREEDDKLRLEREEAEKKAKEEAEKQRIEVAERLKREEKEREERRKRVEAIMSRTRRGGAAATPNSTPVKENDSPKTISNDQENSQPSSTEINSSSDSNSTSGTATTTTTPTPATIPTQMPVRNSNEAPNTQAMYEQAVIDKENSLINSFSNMIIGENVKNLQQQQLQQQPQILEVTNGKLHADDIIFQNTTTTTVANGNGHIENINNKNDINILQDVAPNQLIDLSIESQDLNTVNFNNNNSLLTTTTTATLVTADSHDNQDISLL